MPGKLIIAVVVGLVGFIAIELYLVCCSGDPDVFGFPFLMCGVVIEASLMKKHSHGSLGTGMAWWRVFPYMLPLALITGSTDHHWAGGASLVSSLLLISWAAWRLLTRIRRDGIQARSG